MQFYSPARQQQQQLKATGYMPDAHAQAAFLSSYRAGLHGKEARCKMQAKQQLSIPNRHALTPSAQLLHTMQSSIANCLHMRATCCTAQAAQCPAC